MKQLLIILWGVLICSKPCLGEVPKQIFEHISISQGLSQSEVNCIIQDKKGFIWVGTLDGLNRFDGYDMVVYRKNSTNANTLYNNYIQSLFEDSQGNLWVGTLLGLNLYDNKTDGFIYCKNRKNGVVSNFEGDIRTIIQRKNGDLLVGTNKGLAILPFSNINDPEPIFENYLNVEINYLIEDADGFVWAATWNGLYKIEFNEIGIPAILAHFNHDALVSTSLLSNSVFTLFQDSEKNIWIGSDEGLDLLPSDQLTSLNPKFVNYSKPQYTKFNNVQCVLEVSTGELLIGTRGGGLSFLNRKRQEITIYETDKNDNTSINSNSVKCLLEDRSGVLWIGTLGGGCNKINLYQKPFVNYTITLKNSNQVPSNFIRSIYEDKNNLLWIGTLDDGLYTYNKKDNLFSSFSIQREGKINPAATQKQTKNKESVFSIIEGEPGELWIGGEGIKVINTKTRSVRHHRMDYNNPDSLISNSVFSIVEDDDGSFWIGSWGALHHYLIHKHNGKAYFVRYQTVENNPTTLSDNVVRFVYNDPINSDIWVGTQNGGINRLIKGPDQSIKFEQYKSDGENPGSLSDNSVNMILRSKAGDLWIATADGLNKLIPNKDPKKSTFLKYKEADGLSGDHVQSILEDDAGNLWLGTNKGLSKFNPSTEEFNNFDTFDGLLSYEFSDHACFKNSHGKMYFGGVNGFTSFYPDSIRRSPIVPVVTFTNLILFDKVVAVGKLSDGRVILEKPLSDTKEIDLSYKDKVFTIEFSALHFTAPEKNKYAYKVEGINDDWIFCDFNNRRATFTNLKGGSYTLKVIGSNNDDIWQTDPTVLKINIKPPFWETWPAYITYVLVLLLIVYSIIREVRSKERLKSDLALKQVEKEKLEELNQMKLQFFTNISHEFRTPLTLIIAPLENILSSLRGNKMVVEQLKTIHRNSRYLLNLINELIDFRKAETGIANVKASRNNIVAFMREVLSSFDEISRRKNIKLDLFTDSEELEVWFDRDMMIKVFNNLIFNAFKFTSDGGSISVVIERGGKDIQTKFHNTFKIEQSSNSLNRSVVVKIIDTGIGISSQSLQNIFDRFYQVGSSDSIKHLGSGIGLALAKNLILMNKGEVIVSSERDRGTEFIVILPQGECLFSDHERVADDGVDDLALTVKDSFTHDNFDQSSIDQEDNGFIPTDNKDAPLILVVEDNDDMRYFIKSNLERKYRVIEAKNGLVGCHLAMEEIPDLVVSDVVMPEMDGVQLCRKLKKDVLTSHIPVVLLTALSSVINQIEGLETGADDYISKPFNYKLFEIRIDNLLQSRKKLRERFGQEIEMKAKDFTLNTRDQEFLDKAIQVVKEKISNTEFDVQHLSNDLLMSRMQLFRKIKALTNLTPNEFISTIRLKEAALLLKENKYSISEIAYQVGFTAPSYFSTCFGKQFGLTPKEYLSKYSN
jgi:signal transduction histidine kinase/ligand-binding sensor domain-containing protein/DNA-binding response OmpR family regulator